MFNLVCNQREHRWEIRKDKKIIFAGTLKECKEELNKFNK